MKHSGVITFSIVAAVIFFTGMAIAHQAGQTGSIHINNETGLTQMAKISMNSAIDAALKQVPGKVVKVELENEDGFLVYGVKIVKLDRQTEEVKVDAGDGRILRINGEEQNGEELNSEDKNSEDNDNNSHEKDE